MRDIGKSDRFFELGVSSLTIIELQIGVERELGVTISTSELMRLQTMQEWIEAYSALVPHETESSAEGAM
jgi:acyl carrier protein